MICETCCDYGKACARCRDILKYEMAEFIRNGEKVYLDEQIRYKKGRPAKFIPDQCRIILGEYRSGKSIGRLAKEHGVSKSTIYYAILRAKRIFKPDV